MTINKVLIFWTSKDRKTVSDISYTSMGFRLEKVIMLVGIPLVSILMSFIFYDESYKFFGWWYLVAMAGVVTTLNWLGCRYIVVKLWNKYPWHLYPVKHIIIEVPVVILFTVFLMYAFSRFFYETAGVPIDYVRFWRETAIVIILVAALVSFHEALFFYLQWKDNFHKSLKLEKANMKAEYDVLKNQINPHFLFNNLNTLTTFLEDNEPAVDYVQNLADFLRYTLDIKEQDNKTIKEELDIVKKYVYLQKTRFEENLLVTIQIPEKYYSYKMPAMALQMLVDNAIKHNVISKQKPLSIAIYIEDIYIVVGNTLQKRYGAVSTKQGLENLKNRYAFISEKEIVVEMTDDSFIVKLPLVV